MITEIGSRIVRPIPIVRDIALFGYTIRQILKQKNFVPTFLLSTIQKTGTQYLKVVISNYLIFQFLKEENRLGFVESDERIWNVLKSRDPNNTTIEQLGIHTGYHQWKHEHFNPYIRHSDAKVIIHTYRNPLDWLVSMFYYWFKNRTYDTSGYTHPRDIIDTPRGLKLFARHYNAIEEISHRPNVKRVAYENLIRDPFDTVKDILDFSNIPIYEYSLHRAIDLSSTDWVKTDEQRYKADGRNVVIKTSDNAIGMYMKGSFIRSGTIGEWKEYFNEDDVKKISDILTSNSISLNDFILQ